MSIKGETVLQVSTLNFISFEKEKIDVYEEEVRDKWSSSCHLAAMDATLCFFMMKKSGKTFSINNKNIRQ